MSLEAAKAFRDKVNTSPELQEEVRKALAADALGGGVPVLGRKNGFEFTLQDLEALSKNVELTPFELELVSGGGNDDAPSSSPGKNGFGTPV